MVILYADDSFVVVILVFQLIGEHPACEFLDSVFQDIKDDENEENKVRVVAQIFLKQRGDK